MKYFLVLYDRGNGVIRETREYPAEERQQALQDREHLIRKHTRDPGQTRLEVVLFGAESFDGLKRTHARYFKTADELVRDAKTPADDVVRDTAAAVRR